TPSPTPSPEPSGNRSVTVASTGSVTTTANVARVFATVEVTGTSATEVLSQTNSLLQAVRTAVGALGVSAGDIESGALSVTPGPGDQQASGYRASGSLSITVRDTAQAGAVLEAAANAGADRVSLFFTVDPDDAMLDQARQAAFKR